jgi:hypothetical protein
LDFSYFWRQSRMPGFRPGIRALKSPLQSEAEDIFAEPFGGIRDLSGLAQEAGPQEELSTAAESRARR